MARYPLFPIRLRPDDRSAMEEVKARLGLLTLADSIRFAVRFLKMQLKTLSMKEIKKSVLDYEEENPTCWKITTGD